METGINDSNNGFQPAEEGQEINIMEIAAKLWQNRRKLIKWSAIGAVLGLVVAFSIPKEYDASAKLAPELNTTQKGSGGLSAIAGMIGMNMAATNGVVDAVYPMLYPDVVGSVPFLTGLFDVKVETTGHDGVKGETMTVRRFMEEETRAPWWGAVLGAPGKLIALLKSDDGEDAPGKKVDSFHLSATEWRLVEALGKRISANCDQKSMVVTIGVQMQDPLVAAILADTVVSRLQEYITDYRTSKARNDLVHIEKLNDEARENYYRAQRKYADYLDRNQSLTLRSVQIERDRLENEASLAFGLYNSTSQLLQQSQAKVQENTPAYAVVNPATVPFRPAKPKKLMILIGFTFLAFAGCAAWVLFGKPFIDSHKKEFGLKPGEPESAAVSGSDTPEGESAQ